LYVLQFGWSLVEHIFHRSQIEFGGVSDSLSLVHILTNKSAIYASVKIH